MSIFLPGDSYLRELLPLGTSNKLTFSIFKEQGIYIVVLEIEWPMINNPGRDFWQVMCTLQKSHEPLGKGDQLFLTHNICPRLEKPTNLHCVERRQESLSRLDQPLLPDCRVNESACTSEMRYWKWQVGLLALKVSLLDACVAPEAQCGGSLLSASLQADLQSWMSSGRSTIDLPHGSTVWNLRDAY
jgi:hypothetical protein